MESTGAVNKIQISESSKLLLQPLSGYLLTERGLTYVKGVGAVQTYWLEGIIE